MVLFPLLSYLTLFSYKDIWDSEQIFLLFRHDKWHTFLNVIQPWIHLIRFRLKQPYLNCWFISHHTFIIAQFFSILIKFFRVLFNFRIQFCMPMIQFFLIILFYTLIILHAYDSIFLFRVFIIHKCKNFDMHIRLKQSKILMWRLVTAFLGFCSFVIFKYKFFFLDAASVIASLLVFIVLSHVLAKIVLTSQFMKILSRNS